jgi:hypothetical protein
MKVDIPADHVMGSSKWQKPPKCCEQLKNAFEEKFLFASNIVDGEHDQFSLIYMMPVDETGDLVRRKGVAIAQN